MTIPKKIWAVWLNFNDKADGKIDKRIAFYKKRIVDLHKTWEVNLIEKWDDLINYILEDKLLVELINSPYVIPATKSEALRFFFLKKFGGFWLDYSTFLICSLDVYLENQPKSSFIGYITPSFMVEQIIFNSLGHMMDSVSWREILRKFKDIQSKYIKLNKKYEKYPFIPESFFIASAPNHYIMTDCYNETMKFWKNTLPIIKSKEEVCFEINKNMSRLAREIFDINYMDYNLTTLFNNNKVTDKSFITKLYDNLWHCGYILCYIQMYKSLVKYIKKTHASIKGEDSGIGKLANNSPFTKDLCFTDYDINACENIVITNSKNNEVIYLMSLSYNRLIKWANTTDDRISFHNTYLEKSLQDIINKKISKEAFIKKLKSLGIYQIKFSHWTRDSPILSKLMKIYNRNTTMSKRKSNNKTRKTK